MTPLQLGLLIGGSAIVLIAVVIIALFASGAVWLAPTRQTFTVNSIVNGNNENRRPNYVASYGRVELPKFYDDEVAAWQRIDGSPYYLVLVRDSDNRPQLRFASLVGGKLYSDVDGVKNSASNVNNGSDPVSYDGLWMSSTGDQVFIDIV
jgi:hypothetical protein